MEKTNETEEVCRTITFTAVVDGDQNLYHNVLMSIRYYRQLMSQFLGVVWCAEQSSCSLIYDEKKNNFFFKNKMSLNPLTNEEKEQLKKAGLWGGPVSCLLRQLFHGKTNGKPYYELRPLFFDLNEQNQKLSDETKKYVPVFLAHVWDSLRAQLNVLYTQPDPLLKLPRNLLINSADRGIPAPHHIGLPVKYCAKCTDNAKLLKTDEKTVLSLKFDRNLGWVNFLLEGDVVINGKTVTREMNEGHSYVFHKLFSGQWSFQMPKINEEDGKIRITLSYKRPAIRAQDMDESRVLQVTFNLENINEFISAEVQKAMNNKKLDKVTGIKISGFSLLQQLKRYEAQQSSRERERDSCPKWEKTVNKKRKSIGEHLRNLTEARNRTCQHHLHSYANQILSHAKYKQCGKIKVFDLPHDAPGKPGKKVFFNFSFQAAHFKSVMEYKAKEMGIKLDWEDSEDTIKEVRSALSGN